MFIDLFSVYVADPVLNKISLGNQFESVAACSKASSVTNFSFVAVLVLHDMAIKQVSVI